MVKDQDVMSTQEITKYIEGMIAGEVPMPADPMEKAVAEQLKQKFERKDKIQEIMEQAKKTLEQGQMELQQILGAAGALSTILIKAEKDRRIAAMKPARSKKIKKAAPTNGVAHAQ